MVARALTTMEWLSKAIDSVRARLVVERPESMAFPTHQDHHAAAPRLDLSNAPARFFRALRASMYFLARVWGDIPVVSKERASRASRFSRASCRPSCTIRIMRRERPDSEPAPSRDVRIWP